MTGFALVGANETDDDAEDRAGSRLEETGGEDEHMDPIAYDAMHYNDPAPEWVVVRDKDGRRDWMSCDLDTTTGQRRWFWAGRDRAHRWASHSAALACSFSTTGARSVCWGEDQPAEAEPAKA